MFSAPGPSPRAWGELAQVVAVRFDDRTIPTRVGRTIATPQPPVCITDHPHARGENHDQRGAVYR